MKITAIAAFLALPSANAIYLACCKRENECPEDRKTMELGDDTFKVCCYENETVHPKEKLDDIMACLEPIGTEGGSKIALMSLPVAEDQPANTQFPELAPTDGNEEPLTVIATNMGTIEATSSEAEGPMATNLIITPPEATNTSEEANADASAVTTTTSTSACCGAIAVVQQLRSGTPTSVCPDDMFGVDGASYKGGDVDYQVCCVVEGHQASEFVGASLSPCNEVAAIRPSNDVAGLLDDVGSDATPANSTVDANADADADADTDADANVDAEANADAEKDVDADAASDAGTDPKLLYDSNRASTAQNVAIIGITLVGAAIQAVL